MPRAEYNDFESEQRYGLMEDERVISGQKRICFYYGKLCGKLSKWCPIWIIMLTYPIVYILGFYSGFESNCNCICNSTLT